MEAIQGFSVNRVVVIVKISIRFIKTGVSSLIILSINENTAKNWHTDMTISCQTIVT